MIALALLAGLQAAPDIQLGITVQARELRVERKGKARLEARAEPDAGSAVRVEAPPPAEGAKVQRNVTVRVDAEARIGAGETAASNPR